MRSHAAYDSKVEGNIIFSRLDSGLYTKKLEQMLEARGVDLKDVQSRLNFKQVELTA